MYEFIHSASPPVRAAAERQAGPGPRGLRVPRAAHLSRCRPGRPGPSLRVAPIWPLRPLGVRPVPPCVCIKGRGCSFCPSVVNDPRASLSAPPLSVGIFSRGPSPQGIVVRGEGPAVGYAVTALSRRGPPPTLDDLLPRPQGPFPLIGRPQERWLHTGGLIPPIPTQFPSRSFPKSDRPFSPKDPGFQSPLLQKLRSPPGPGSAVDGGGVAQGGRHDPGHHPRRPQERRPRRGPGM